MELNPKDISKIMYYISNEIEISYENDISINPCAGKGEFVDALETLTKFNFHYENFDENDDDKTHFKHPRITSLNFLDLDYSKYDKTILSGLWYNKVHIISHPPEAKANLFIEACSQFANTMSFILPISDTIADTIAAYPFDFIKKYKLHFEERINEHFVLKIWKKIA
jgi:hypothetical protein